MVEHLPLMVYYHLQISSSQCAGIGMIKPGAGANRGYAPAQL
jgi:hypothetical protein